MDNLQIKEPLDGSRINLRERMRLIIGVKNLIVLLQNYKTQYMLLALLLLR